jgi:type IX secretion system PorP/SprF family membrane protein
MKRLLICLLLLAFSKAVTAQQDPQYSQYTYNPIVVNPAYAGNRGVASIMGLHRSQWVGLDGAPRTQTLSFHTPISNSKVGLGLSIVNDEIGPSNETYVSSDFSYTISVGDQKKLSFGLKGGAHILNIDYTRLNVFDAEDLGLTENVENKLSPILGLGLYYHTKKFYLGLSSPNLLQTDHFEERMDNSSTYISRERRHLFVAAGYVYNLNDAVKFKPATMVKIVQGAPLQLDLTASFLFDDTLSLGAAYRWNAAVTGIVGFQLSDQMLIGFAYDREITRLGNAIFNDGSYELFIRFELHNRYDRIITPRFF